MKNLIYIIPYILGYLFVSIIPQWIFLIIPVFNLINGFIFKNMYDIKIIKINTIIINTFIFITLIQPENYRYHIGLGYLPFFFILIYIVNTVYLIRKNIKSNISNFIKDMLIMVIFMGITFKGYLYLLGKILFNSGYIDKMF